MNNYNLVVEVQDEGTRIDTFIAGNLDDISRSYCKKLIIDGNILVNGKNIKPSYLVIAKDEVTVNIDEPTEAVVKPQNIPIDIIFEDDDIIVVNKQRGMVVHPSAGHDDGTLVNALLFHCDKMPVIGGQTRPGIVHRIDKDTTGLLVVAKNDIAHIKLSEQIKEKSAGRKYKALVEGRVKEDNGEINAPIGRHRNDRKKMSVVLGAREAVSFYSVDKRFKKHTLLTVKLMTGRTHQIRVHMAYINHAVVGDKTYGYKKQQFNLEGQLLHAYELSFNHPKTNERMTFAAPLPMDFEEILKKI